MENEGLDDIKNNIQSWIEIRQIKGIRSKVTKTNSFVFFPLFLHQYCETGIRDRDDYMEKEHSYQSVPQTNNIDRVISARDEEEMKLHNDQKNDSSLKGTTTLQSDEDESTV